MKELLVIAIGSALVNNVVLSQFLGICPFLGVSKKVETAAGMGAAVIFVITLASFVTSVIDKVLLIPLKMTYLQTIVFILVIACLVQFVEMFLKKTKDVIQLADLLGHGSVDTTRIYLQKSYDEQQRDFNKNVTW